MRRRSDLPGRVRRRSRLRSSGRYLLIGGALAVLVVIVLGRAVARFYVDELWFDALGQSGVFWRALRAKATLFAMFLLAFFLLAGVNLAVADKVAPTRFPVNAHPYVERFHEIVGRRVRLSRYLTAGALGLVMALPTTNHWQEWLLYRNSRPFGTADAQFGVDVGFYVFELPFVSFVLDWLFLAMVLVLLVTTLAHVINGGVVFSSPLPSVSPAMKGHLAVLLAVLAALKAADYWVRRYEATNVRRGFVQGPTYSVVHAQLPALLLLAVVALITAGLYLSTLKTQSWRLPLVSSAVWLVLAIVGGYVYPAAVQSLVVRPNQQSREAEYIEHNVEATRQAMGIDDTRVRVVPVQFGPLSADDVAGDLGALRDVRLLNPVESRPRFQLSEGQAAGLTIDDLDVDRYDLDGELQQVLVAAKELDIDGAANQSWQGRHLINTHGCGVVMAPASSVEANGLPAFQNIELSRPELYFSPSISGWAVAGSEEGERDCGGDTQYRGTSGVEMSSWWRRAAFALAFMDYNLIGSGAIHADSQMLWNRNVRDRVEKLAPFLTYDGDPYPVALDGRVVWVIDAYTSTSRYPYAEAVGGDVVLSEGSGVPRDANYIRNSVKVVIDAYDGSVQFYVIDPFDPIVSAWNAAFPDLFSPQDEMPAELREHLRYPEDLFRVQTNVYSKYQLDPADFFDRDGAWSVAQAPSAGPRDLAAAPVTPTGAPTAADQVPDLATETSNNRFVPYYTLFEGVGEQRVTGAADFVLLRPFVPFSRDDQRTELQAFMAASSDPDDYGELTVYVVEGPSLPEGPRSVALTIESDPDIGERIGRLNQARTGTSVRFGDLQLVPIADGLLWVRPFYVANQEESSPVSSVIDYQFMIVVYQGEAAYGRTIGEALGEIFGGLDVEVGERDRSSADVEAPGEIDPAASPPLQPGAVDPAEPSTTTPGAAATSRSVLLEVHDLLVEADEALAAGDLGTYQQRVEEASDLLAEHVGAAPGTAPEQSPPPVTVQ